jgi:hypothetical protein
VSCAADTALADSESPDSVDSPPVSLDDAARGCAGMAAAMAVAMTIAIHRASVALGARAAPAASRGTSPVGQGASRPDGWLDALAKLVPGEAIVAYHAALRVPGDGTSMGIRVAILVALTVAVPVLLWTSARRTGITAPWLQYAVRPLTFALYGFGSDDVLGARLGTVGWIPKAGALVIALLAALVLSPPGAQRPPPDPDA